MTIEQQTVYLGGALKWKKDKYKVCNDAPKGDACVYADKLRTMREKKRNTDKYYAKTKEERDKDDAAAAAAEAGNLKEIVAAAKPIKPVGLAIGASCVKNGSGVRPTCAEGHCCGLAKKGFFGAKKEVCDVKTNTTHAVKNGEVTESWTFGCILGA